MSGVMSGSRNSSPPSFHTISEIVIHSDSHGGAFGATSREYSWCARLAKALDADLKDRAVDGAVGIFDDTSSSKDGGYNTVWDFLTPARTAAPYITDWPTAIFMHGYNDLAEINVATAADLEPIKAMWRGEIGRHRCARIVEDSDTALITYSGTPGVTWSSVAAGGGWGSGDTLRSCATVGAYFEYTVPADYNGGTVWIGTVTGSAGQGAQFTITKNGGSATQHDTRNLYARRNEIQKIFFSSGVTGGTFTLTWNGQTTSAITYPASNSTIQSALEALSNIAPGDVEVYDIGVNVDRRKYVEFKGANALTDVAAMTKNDTGLTGTTPTITISTPRAGGSSARINGHAWPVKNCVAGDVIRVTVDAVNTNFYFDWIGLEAEAPPMTLFPLRFRCQTYQLWDGTIKGDAAVELLRTAQREFAAEFNDGRVITFDVDHKINKEPRYFTTLDFAHLNDLGHEVMTEGGLEALATKGPRDYRSAVVGSQKSSDLAYANTWKDAVRCVAADSTTRFLKNVDILAPGGSANFDGVQPITGNRVLLASQTNAAENGIYYWVTGTSPLIRTEDANSAERLRDGTTVKVQEGAHYANKDFVLSTNGPYTLGVTAITWNRSGSRMVQTLADQTGITNSVVDISGLAIPVAAGEVVTARWNIVWDASGATTSLGLGVNCPASPTQFSARITVASATNAETILHTNTPDARSTQTASAGSTRTIALIEAVLRNGANAGTFVPRAFRNGATGTVNVRAGSWGEWR